MTNPKIAVLFPVYNPGPELAETLASIRDQSLPSRLFLIDDGSKRKPDYAPLIKGMDVHLIELPKNQGIVGAMNAGLAEILKGDFEFVARIDNGDINDLQRYQKQIAYLNAHPDLAFVGSHVRAEFRLNGLNFDFSFPETHEECLKTLRYNSAMAHGAIMYRMSFIRAFKAYTDKYPAAEDYAMQQWAVAHGFRMGNVPESLYRAIELSDSISANARGKQLWSRFRLQRDYADWLNPHSYIGMARTLTLLALPVTPLRVIKRLLSR
ncbi:MAG: glycosyltransferase [Alphaproteobacteria bacterium]|nr:glycosyltransferase [Alphaproteobacteria bacterium]